MQKSKRKFWKRLLSGILIALALGTAYTVYDNQRFIVVEQEIVIDRLPPSFDGFRILQISDLHGRSFGERQANLVSAINGLDYDMIALTGDMNASTASDSLEDSRAILDLLDGIQNKAHVFWVDGNTGPYASVNIQSIPTRRLTEIGSVLRAKGCEILVLPGAVTRGGNKIWITPEMSEALLSSQRATLENTAALTQLETIYGIGPLYEIAQPAYREASAAFQAIKGNGEIKIMLAHTPRPVNSTAEDLQMMGDLDYDLILAGHYHGGQLRLPVIGAIYIPSPFTGINNSGFFPAPEVVKGISYYGDVPQYVSAGLGASGHVSWVSFRLFNTPEINLITLRRP